MNFTISGSLGNISKPLTELLVRQGHAVTVVSSDAQKKSAIAALGAVAAIGSIGDAVFLATAFAGADAVYAMIPMSFTETDQAGYMRRMAAAYVEAVRTAGVKRVVVLSGWAADLLAEGAEQAFDWLTDVAVSILRPASFYGKPWLKWVRISDKAMLRGLKMAKVPEKLAESLVEMQAAMHKGTPLFKAQTNLSPLAFRNSFN